MVVLEAGEGTLVSEQSVHALTQIDVRLPNLNNRNSFDVPHTREGDRALHSRMYSLHIGIENGAGQQSQEQSS